MKTTLRTAEKLDTKAAAKKSPAADDLLGIIRPVINRMRGAVTATGSYFIPLQETTQITIGCSMIPVVELDDGTTVLLDYGNRLSENLKELIRQSWKNYAFLTAEELRDGLGGLLGIIRHSKNYRMVRTDKPLELMVKPEILIFPDWLITGKETAGGVTYRQGLFLLDRGGRPPAEAKEFIEKSGVAVTEIAGDRALSSVETPPTLRPAMVDLRGLRASPSRRSFSQPSARRRSGTPMSSSSTRPATDSTSPSRPICSSGRERSGSSCKQRGCLNSSSRFSGRRVRR